MLFGKSGSLSWTSSMNNIVRYILIYMGRSFAHFYASTSSVISVVSVSFINFILIFVVTTYRHWRLYDCSSTNETTLKSMSFMHQQTPAKTTQKQPSARIYGIYSTSSRDYRYVFQVHVIARVHRSLSMFISVDWQICIPHKAYPIQTYFLYNKWCMFYKWHLL